MGAPRTDWFKRAPVIRIVWFIVMLISWVIQAISYVICCCRRHKTNKYSTQALESLAKQRAGITDDFDDKFHSQVLQFVFPSLLQSEIKHFLPIVNFAEMLEKKLVVERTLKDNTPISLELPKVFIIGLPRTGSTLLHQLCSLDPNARTVKAWEYRKPPCFNESEQVRLGKSTSVQQQLDGFYNVAPQFKHIHYIRALDADECVQGFFDLAMPDWYVWGAIDAPEAFAWYVNGDMTPQYENYARFLRTLPMENDVQFMWLKSPHHTFKLREVAKVFPGCKFVWLHRDQVENTVASCCSMNQAILDVVSPWYVDPKVLGKRTTSRLVHCVRKAMADREVLEREGVQFVDMSYSELKRNGVGAMRDMYTKLDKEFSPEFQSNLEVFFGPSTLSSSTTPPHRYLHSNFGINTAQVRGEFKEYLNKYCDS